MASENQINKFLTVAPFECAWPNDLRFKEPGRGCVAFEAFAHNDVTLVFREHVGSQYYHYKTDNSPHYTVIIGSHRNRRLKIEVDGKTVVDVAGANLCCSPSFQSYWISIYDGLISIGKGRYPFQNLFLQWLDSKPNCSVQYVGLSSWDKHVGYRNVNILSISQNPISLFGGEYGNVVEDDGGDVDEDDGHFGNWGLKNFLENWELSDVIFLVGSDERTVPAHKAILACAGNFGSCFSGQTVIQLPDVSYSVLHAFLQYIYIGHAKVPESEVIDLRAMSLKYEVLSLVKQCEEIMERFILNKSLFESGKNVEISHPSSRPRCGSFFPAGLPLNMHMLQQFFITGEYSDVDIYVDGHGLIGRLHKIILALGSIPFSKMLTNGMSESISSKVVLRDVPIESFKIMLEFMYCGEINQEESINVGTLVLELLLLADQFGVTSLHQDCCKTLLEGLSEDTTCSILRVISSVPSCKLIEEKCEQTFAMHFDYCTTTSIDFVLLDEVTFSNVLKHPDLTVTSEERILNAILLWCSQATEEYNWEVVDEKIFDLTLYELFGERSCFIDNFLPLVRFPLLADTLLKKLERSNLSRKISTLHSLVEEAIKFSESGLVSQMDDQKYQHRRSSFKDRQFICDGDSNGVLYFAGTSYGEHQWMNPVLSKRINISASSPVSRFTDPKVLAARTYQGTSFAGPRIEDGKNSTWWMVDVGQDHQLMCNYYTLRQDGSRAYIRSWKFQGSMDGKTWTNVRVHENDQTMCKPGQYASWAITGPSALLPFRFFKVILTAPSTDETWNFCICFLELYGYFH
ncbi:BTB/POZ domain-containing protein At2g30600 [Impatiens glandulifera]|uniref:BTB/POZ domain-containing protein At2g30600 n=1 Tax=Impatiens glandulifera TaxID=253017 RepID=UPI001FB17868|nr:BTB/POZ domain-containing protein At2g30600 [Impatiens glandulifera]